MSIEIDDKIIGEIRRKMEEFLVGEFSRKEIQDAIIKMLNDCDEDLKGILQNYL
jgi:hypothetical protein